MPPHPLAGKAPRVQLGRYAKAKVTTSGPVFSRRRIATRPDKVAGQHRWVSVSWHYITRAAALSVARGARFNPDVEDRIAVSVGCLDCQGTWSDVGDQPCPAPAIETVPAEEPAPLAEPEPDAVPVDPPTPPDAEPPVVTGDASIGALAETISETALSPVRVEP